MIQVDSIGAGTGSFVRINPNSNRPELGPDSAGSRIGVCWPEGELETPSVSDLNLVLGRLNPDYFLGGDVKLDAERARAAIDEQLAQPLGLSVEHAAAGILELFDETLQYEASGQVLGKGYSPVDYALFCYGGGGPLHVAGYTNKITYRDVLVPAWAAGFSAFGCACADLEYRSDLTIDLPILPGAGDDAKAVGGGRHPAGVGCAQGPGGGRVREIGGARERRRVSVLRPYAVLRAAQRHRDLLARPAARRRRRHRRADRCVRGRVREGLRALGEVARTRLPRHLRDRHGRRRGREAGAPERGARPGQSPSGARASAPCGGATIGCTTTIYEQSDLRAGNVVRGPAIVESPADTLAVPPGRRARLDEHRIFHIETEEG